MAEAKSGNKKPWNGAPSSSLLDPSKKASLTPSKDTPSASSAHKTRTAPSFPSYKDTPDLPPKVKLLCEALSKFPVPELESALTSTGIQPLPEEVEGVLKLSYGSPAAAVKFFRWVALHAKHTPYAWNLLVDILGKNKLFEATWDAIRSMRQEGLLSLPTFTSVFNSYAMADKVDEAVMTFDVIDRYGIPHDIVAVNSFLSAICTENKTYKALEFFDRIKSKVPPNGDTFAILLEGWEKEGNAAKAKHTFGEMIVRIGWDAKNMSAYDAFLTTLVKGSDVEDALKFLKVMQSKNCLPGMKFFSNAIDILIKQNYHSQAYSIWELMVTAGLLPTLPMYKSMIGLLCNNNQIDSAFGLLDEMVYNGAFPDSQIYNSIFFCLIKNKKVHEASSFFSEMMKNEVCPTHSNCASAVKMFLDGYNPVTATAIWQCMIDNAISPKEESANFLLIGLCDLDRLLEVRKYAEDMLDRGVSIYSSTMAKVRSSFVKSRKEDMYDRIARRWKAH